MSGATSRAVARGAPIRVVVVEDSLVQRAFLVGVLEADGDIVVVGQATTAREAIVAVGQMLPDVVTLDLQIPEGGGQYALEQIMALTPTPVVVLSGTVQNEKSAPAIDALVAGALLALPKPLRWTPALEHELRRNVRMLRNVPVIRRLKGLHPARSTGPTGPTAGVAPPTTTTAASSTTVVAIGASTGGPPALATVLGGLVGLRAPVLVVQHLHAYFVSGLVDWMARVSPLPVVVAVHGQELRRGCVYIAPGGTHLRVAPGRRIELAERPATLHR
ncbi:MAG: chemotaxis protein CheB, partial [Ilumatobacteraceae bacterium]